MHVKAVFNYGDHVTFTHRLSMGHLDIHSCTGIHNITFAIYINKSLISNKDQTKFHMQFQQQQQQQQH